MASSTWHTHRPKVAIQYAKYVGAHIYATAGSEEKHAYLPLGWFPFVKPFGMCFTISQLVCVCVCFVDPSNIYGVACSHGYYCLLPLALRSFALVVLSIMCYRLRSGKTLHQLASLPRLLRGEAWLGREVHHKHQERQEV